MRFKELLQSPKTIANSFGAFKFGTDIFKEDEMTPHKEMEKCYELFETRPLINSGIRQMARFIMGVDIDVVGEDEYSKKYVKTFIDQRQDLLLQMESGITHALISGNTYVQELNLKVGENYQFDGFQTFPDSSKVYINLENEDPTAYYYIEVPTLVKQYLGYTACREKILYFLGENIFKKTISCIKIPRSKFHHLKIGFSRDSFYGRSYLASVIDDGSSLKEILKNIAVISRYRALNTKFIMPANNADELMEDDIEDAKQQLVNIRDGEHLFVNKPMKIESMSNTNEYDTMINEVDFLRKDISSGLVPNFITPFNSEVNRATAEEAKIPFMLELEYMQRIFESFYSKILINGIRRMNLKVDKNTKIKFRDVDLTGKQEKIQYMLNLYNSGLVTANEVRLSAGMEKVVGFDKYSWQIGAPEQSAMGDLN